MKLHEIDLKLLVPLEALLSERNISRAALRVGMSQSAMSKALSRLRIQFGDQLLIRVGQEYCLSPFAESLLPDLQDALITLDRTLARRPRFDPRVGRRVFRIAATDSLDYLLIKPLLQRIAEDAPGVSLEIRTVAGEETLNDIRSSEIDLCLTSITYPKSDLAQQVLFADRRICVVWAGLAGIGEALTQEQLLRLPHLAFDWTGWNLFTSEYPEWGWLERLAVRATDVRLFMRLFMLRGTNYVTFTWESLGRSIAEFADIRVVEPPFPSTIVQHRMLWHPRDNSDPGHRWLRDQLVEIVESLGVHVVEATVADSTGRRPQ